MNHRACAAPFRGDFRSKENATRPSSRVLEEEPYFLSRVAFLYPRQVLPNRIMRRSMQHYRRASSWNRVIKSLLKDLITVLPFSDSGLGDNERGVRFSRQLTTRTNPSNYLTIHGLVSRVIIVTGWSFPERKLFRQTRRRHRCAINREYYFSLYCVLSSQNFAEFFRIFRNFLFASSIVESII